MFTSQIRSALASDPVASQYFAGVFPSDMLPDKIPFPCSAIANTDPASKPGRHWVAFHFDSEGNGEYFDSYGKPPCNTALFNFLVDKNVKCETPDVNPVRLQGFDSDVCGQYCIAFLTKRARGKSMQNIVESFRGKTRKPGAGDTAVARSVNRMFKISKLKKRKLLPVYHSKQQQQQQHQLGGSARTSVAEQCCCSLSSCYRDRVKECRVQCKKQIKRVRKQ
jgi:hypothetical protein